MLQKIMERVLQLAKEHMPKPPADFDDPLALKTEWSPLVPGGASFRTRKLVQARPNRIEFRATFGTKVFYAVFLAMGLGVSCIVPVVMFIVGGELKPQLLLPFLGGLPFVLAGGWLLRTGSTPIVFDLQRECFWKGRAEPSLSNRESLKEFQELDGVRALQVISEYVRGSKNSYTSYELNLVVEDASRVNVIDHGSLKNLRADAETLARFLDVPVWDAVNR